MSTSSGKKYRAAGRSQDVVRGGRVKTLSFGKFGFRHKLFSMDKRGICQKENWRSARNSVRDHAEIFERPGFGDTVSLALANRAPPHHTRRHGRRRQAPRQTKCVRSQTRRLRRSRHGRERTDQARRLSLRRGPPNVRGGLFSPLLRPVLLRLRRECAAAVQGDHGRDAPVREPGQGARLGVHQPVRMLLQAPAGRGDHVPERQDKSSCP